MYALYAYTPVLHVRGSFLLLLIEEGCLIDVLKHVGPAVVSKALLFLPDYRCPYNSL